MLQLKKNRSAFTLIELLVVVIIIAVLAAVGVPLLSANVDRSRMTEAETGLGTIRTSLRAYGIENPTAFPADPTVLSFVASDFQGQFFNLGAYSFTGPTTFANYCILANGTTSTAPGAAKVLGKVRSMDENGTIYSNNNCSGT